MIKINKYNCVKNKKMVVIKIKIFHWVLEKNAIINILLSLKKMWFRKYLKKLEKQINLFIK
jgi:hypothetical protein